MPDLSITRRLGEAIEIDGVSGPLVITVTRGATQKEIRIRLEADRTPEVRDRKAKSKGSKRDARATYQTRNKGRKTR